jgi:hypothetical protein
MGVFNRNIVDDTYNETDVALCQRRTARSYSTTIDLGDVDSVGENHELLITIPDLTVTHLPNADTLTVAVAAGAATDPTALIADAIEVLLEPEELAQLEPLPAFVYRLTARDMFGSDSRQLEELGT